MVSIFIRTLIIYILLSISMKIMGKREIGELDVSELVSTLLISEIAAIPIDDPDIPLMNAIIPIIFILSLEILLSYAKTRFNKIKRYVEGEPVFLIYKNTIRQKVLMENRISLNEILSEMRSQGIGDIGDIEYALLEQSGKISMLKKSESEMSHILVIDGEYNTAEIENGSLSKSDIQKELDSVGITIKDVFLMTVDSDNNLKIIKKVRK